MLLMVALWSATPAHACSGEEVVLDDLACDSAIDGDLLAADPHELDWVYECGTPDHGLYEDGPEDFYTFSCPDIGEVQFEIHGALCDMDLYILSDECSPRGPNCIAGDTRIALSPLDTKFMCEYVGQQVYVVVEGMGLVDREGLCSAPTAGEYEIRVNQVIGACDITPLAVDGDPWPGIAGMENTFRAAGGTAEMTFYTIVGTGLGEGAELPGCPGVHAGVTGMHRLGPQRINPGGYGEKINFIPEVAAGLTTWIQVLQLDTCEISEPYEYTWL